MKTRRVKEKQHMAGRGKAAVEIKRIDAVDRYAEFCELENVLLKSLRKDLRKGLNSDEIYKKYEDLAAARTISLLVEEQDSAKVLAIIKEIRDRASGRPKEKKEITHKLAYLSDNELKALVASEINELDEPLITTDEEKI